MAGLKRKTSTFTVHEAKTQFSKLLRKIEAGEEVIISKGPTPVAKLISIHEEPVRELGFARGEVLMTAGFDEALDYESFLGK